MTAMIEADGVLPPAKEHVYDALAALDRGQLQEAQNAFDLSVWADVKSDRGRAKPCMSSEPPAVASGFLLRQELLLCLCPE